MATTGAGMATNEDLSNLNSSYVNEYYSENGQMSDYCPTYFDLSASTYIKTDLTPVSGSMTNVTPLALNTGGQYTTSGSCQSDPSVYSLFGNYESNNYLYEYLFMNGSVKYRSVTIPPYSKITFECTLHNIVAYWNNNSNYYLTNYTMGNSYPAFLVFGKTTTATPNGNFYAYTPLELKVALNNNSANTRTTASFEYENTTSLSITGYLMVLVNRSLARISNVRIDAGEYDRISEGYIYSAWQVGSSAYGTKMTGGSTPPSTLVPYSKCQSLTYYPQMTLCINPLSGTYAVSGAVGNYNIKDITWKAEYIWDGSVKLTKSDTTPGNLTGTCLTSAISYTLITLSGTSTPHIKVTATMPMSYLKVSTSTTAVTAVFQLYYTGTTANGGTVTGYTSGVNRTFTKTTTSSYYNFYAASSTVTAYIYPKFKAQDDMIQLTVELNGTVNIGGGGCSARSIGEWDA